MTEQPHRNPPFRAEHLGSLLRPKELLKTRVAVDKEQAAQQQLSEAEDTAVQDIVKTQLDLGFHAISDGEYRRHSKTLVVASALDQLTLCSVLG